VFSYILNRCLDAGMKPYYIRYFLDMDMPEMATLLRQAGICNLAMGDGFTICRGGGGSEAIWDMRAGKPCGLKVLREKNDHQVVVRCDIAACAYHQACRYEETCKDFLEERCRRVAQCKPVSLKGRPDTTAPNLTKGAKELVALYRHAAGLTALDIHEATGYNVNAIVKFIMWGAHKNMICKQCHQPFVWVSSNDLPNIDTSNYLCKGCIKANQRKGRGLMEGIDML